MFIYGFSFTSHVPLLLRVQYTYFLLLKLFGERWPLLHSTTQFHPHSVRKNVRLLIVSLRHSMPSVQLAQPLYGGFPSPVPAQSAQKLLREKEGLPLYLIHNLRSVNCVGAIRIFSCGSRRTGQAVIRNDFSFGSHKISSVFNSVQFVDRYLVEVYHISDYMIGTLLFLKRKPQQGMRCFRGMVVTLTERSS